MSVLILLKKFQMHNFSIIKIYYKFIDNSIFIQFRTIEMTYGYKARTFF